MTKQAQIEALKARIAELRERVVHPRRGEFASILASEIKVAEREIRRLESEAA